MTPTEKVIEAFGGATKLANHLRINKQNINHWIASGRIPSKYHGDLIRLRRALEIDISIEDICK